MALVSGTGAAAGGTAAENNAFWIPAVIIIAAILETADKVLVAKDAVDISVAVYACNSGDMAACGQAEDMAKQAALDAGIEFTIGGIIPGSKAAADLLRWTRKNADADTVRRIDRVVSKGNFSEIQARNTDEAQFLRNAEATFENSSTWTGVTRHRGELVVQRSDIELSQQNVARMRNGQAPFVRNADGDWELLQLHHVGREKGQMIEVTRSQNRYNHATGGPLHIPGPGGPIRQPNYSQSYWQERYQGFVNSGQISE